MELAVDVAADCDRAGDWCNVGLGEEDIARLGVGE